MLDLLVDLTLGLAFAYLIFSGIVIAMVCVAYWKAGRDDSQ